MNKIGMKTSSMIMQMHESGNYRGVLASMRGAASFASPKAQAVWPIMMETLETDMLSKNGKPSYAEKAIYAALRIYAIHQQGKDELVYGHIQRKNKLNAKAADKVEADSTKKQEAGSDFFTALAELRKNENLEVALDRRVRQTLATTDVNSVINSLNHLIGIIKANNSRVKIDYGKLAEDLYRFQMSYESANKVRLDWGQKYYGYNKKTKGENNEQ
ncbi:type I-E CRISPR-associated protein Cse2/CasB [Lactobacillus xylocopicola]|uniref:Type I-E CRISPR-associated protein Cse2/CasB n=1 Tax=Lactobacillus xylocopicola TaxID=2976676 RepID=A0ABN6SMA0_9LACO|nr:type I-E CRISPR-associated protein Cse2/CasB [Lactobacillus xylocopicola]BDR60579.1 type I-E CRISPR-associated protein Cse2/CasB [Lactobacillus xylocopicola]